MIEDLWRDLAAGAGDGAQTRVDEGHPLDIYADLQPPDQVGLVAVCGTRPPNVRPMRALAIEAGRRADGRWALRLSLLARPLLPVFAALCRDIIACTRSGVDEARLGEVVIQRLVHWRSLLEREPAGLDESVLRGLIGELLVLRDRQLPLLGTAAAVASWHGPMGAPQDFMMPDGEHLEVKVVGPYAETVRINGLAQLDAGGSRLKLIVIRAEKITPQGPDAATAPRLVAALRTRLGVDPEALEAFEAALRCVGWHEHPAHEEIALRVLSTDEHTVGPEFPRLIRSSVPTGIVEAEYDVALPARRVDPGGEAT